jgi:L-threonylcarbamoyladenylate synthase
MPRFVQQGNNLLRGSIIGTSPADIAAAAACILAGDLVGMPTETVYGLAADATQGEAVAAIYEAKGRPRFNPLISHVSNLDMAQTYGVFNHEAQKLAEAFWPGPLTLIMPFREGSGVSDLARAGLDSIGLRVPAHPAAQALIKAAGRPLAAPSANRSGRISPTSAQDVMAELGGEIAVVIDGGGCSVGVESTIIACLDSQMVQLRPGGIPLEALEAAAGQRIGKDRPTGPLRAPGLLESHYAPAAPLRMNAVTFAPGEAILAFGPCDMSRYPPDTPFVNLSETGDLREAAARLFSALRELDNTSPNAIAVMPVPASSLGEAINDRLTRAAAPKVRTQAPH